MRTKNETKLERVSDTELVITRLFNATPDIVFEAWTSAEWVKRWFAPKSRGVTMVSTQADVRVGGRYRHVFAHPQAGEMAFSGEYREVVANQRVVHTEGFEPQAKGVEGEPSINTVTFEARGAQTLVTAHTKFSSKEVLEMVVETGMEEGMRETLDQLDALVSAR